MTTLVELDGAARWFGSGHTEVTALHPTTSRSEAGELLAVMGPSGSGKTTLLSLVGGLDRPSRGRVIVDGHDVGALNAGGPRDPAPPHRRLRLPGPEPARRADRARERVAAAGARRQSARDEARAAAEAALDSVGLATLADRFPDDLSGGEQQRVAIARALVGGRRILLADEPTGALDSITGESVMRLLRAHCDGGGTAILVTHDAAHAAWADRVVFLRDGRDRRRGAAAP